MPRACGDWNASRGIQPDVSFRLVIAFWAMIDGTSRRNGGPHRMLRHHGLRVATTGRSAVLLWKLLMLLR